MVTISCASDATAATAWGAHIRSWRVDGLERLYSSPLAIDLPGKPFRGGIPVIFPQFGLFGTGPKHGFARAVEWRVINASGSAASFELDDSPETHVSWPYPFRARLDVECSHRTLFVSLSVLNTGATETAFTAGLHTYLRVPSLAGARLFGLQNHQYLDATRDGLPSRLEDGPFVGFGPEIDRVYLDAPESLTLETGAGSVQIMQSGFLDTVVWNPGPDLAASMPDLGPGEHEFFVCVEAATVHEPVQLPPGRSWTGSQTLIV